MRVSAKRYSGNYTPSSKLLAMGPSQRTLAQAVKLINSSKKISSALKGSGAKRNLEDAFREAIREGSNKRPNYKTTPMSKGGRRKRVTSGYSAGRLRTPSKRLSRNVATIQKHCRLGVSKSYEYAKVQESATSKCNYVGHSVASIGQIREVLFMAIVKKFSMHSNHPFGTWDDEVPRAFSADGCAWQLTYRLDQSQPTGEAYVSYSMTGDYSTTWRDVASYFFLNTPSTSTDLTFIRMTWFPAGSNADSLETIKMQLTNATITLDCKSAMKLQNRTISETGQSQANDVDNQPLVGKSYEGKGFGTYVRPGLFKQVTTGGEEFSVMSSSIYGVIDRFDEGINALAEPPLPYMVKASKSGKVRLEPGNVKFSTLTYHISKKLDALYSMLCATNQLYSAQQRFGVYRFFALEKLVDCILPSAENAIRIGYEVQNEVSATVRTKKVTFTNPDHVTQIYVPPTP